MAHAPVEKFKQYLADTEEEAVEIVSRNVDLGHPVSIQLIDSGEYRVRVYRWKAGV